MHVRTCTRLRVSTFKSINEKKIVSNTSYKENDSSVSKSPDPFPSEYAFLDDISFEYNILLI